MGGAHGRIANQGYIFCLRSCVPGLRTHPAPHGTSDALLSHVALGSLPLWRVKPSRIVCTLYTKSFLISTYLDAAMLLAHPQENPPSTSSTHKSDRQGSPLVRLYCHLSMSNQPVDNHSHGKMDNKLKISAFEITQIVRRGWKLAVAPHLSSSEHEWLSHAQPFFTCTDCSTRSPQPSGGACVNTNTDPVQKTHETWKHQHK